MNKEESDLQPPTTYIADSHALYWYFKHPERLSPAVDVVFRLAETENALILAPAIVIAELYFLSVKLGQPFSPSEILEAMRGVEGIYLSDLGIAQLERLDLITDIPEMHDRLIAAEAMALDAPLLTRDQTLAQSQHVTTIW